MKIISLVPSITETLLDFGLDENQVIGRTKFCIHPENIVSKIPKIGGTKNLNIEKIKALNPDFIIANKEENEKFQVEELLQNFKIWVTDIQNLEDNSIFLAELGEILGKQNIAKDFITKTENIFNSLKFENSKKIKAAYLIWKNPYMTVGSDTFIHHILENLGFENIFKNTKRYPEISIDDLRDAETILLSSEPYPFKEKHIEELQQEFPDKKIILVDGEAFSWYGSHLSKCEEYYQIFLENFK